MPKVRAVLLDVYDTVLTVDFEAALEGLLAATGLTRDEWSQGTRAHGQDIMIGAITPEQAFAATFRLAQKSPGDLQSLVRLDLELIQEHATLYPDVIPFIDELQCREVNVALVSNCAPNTGPLLDALGLADRVDQVLLSCEVGSAKPDAGIYRAALDALRVDPADVLFVDDQASYCSGAQSLGMTAVRIDRRGMAPGSVRTPRDVLPIVDTP